MNDYEFGCQIIFGQANLSFDITHVYNKMTQFMKFDSK